VINNRPLASILVTPTPPSRENKASSSAISPKRGEREGWRGSKISSPPFRRAVSFSKFDRAGKQTGRDFWLLNSPKRKLGINYY